MKILEIKWKCWNTCYFQLSLSCTQVTVRSCSSPDKVVFSAELLEIKIRCKSQESLWIVIHASCRSTCVFGLNMAPWRHGIGGRDPGLAGCPSGPTPLVGFDSFPPNMGKASRMFWKDRLPPCQSVPYLLLKMAAFASRGADAHLPIKCPTPLGVATSPRRRSLLMFFNIHYCTLNVI